MFTVLFPELLPNGLARLKPRLFGLQVIVPELLRGEPGEETATEARLALHIWGSSPAPTEWYVDVTVVHPWAVRNRHDLTPGYAAQRSEEAKFERYGDGSGGVVLTPAVVEAFGRMGAGFLGLLGQLEARWATVKGKSASAAATTKRRWCAQLGVAIVRAQALTVRLADRPPRAAVDLS